MMKMNRKRALMILLALLPALTVSLGCKAAPAFSLADKGLELVLTMAELAGQEEYRAAVSASGELNDAMAKMAGDYASPKAVYDVTLPEGTVQALLGIHGELPSALTDWFEGRICASVSSMIAARQGAATLAAIASVNYAKSFVCAGMEQPVLYIYQYEGDFCAAVCFVPGDDGAVSGSASFVPSDELLRLAASAGDVQAWLTDLLGYAVTVERVR